MAKDQIGRRHIESIGFRSGLSKDHIKAPLKISKSLTFDSELYVNWQILETGFFKLFLRDVEITPKHINKNGGYPWKIMNLSAC